MLLQVALAAACLFSACCHAVRIPVQKEQLIGWAGETFDRARTFSGHSQVWSEALSWKPRIFVYHNLLSPEECNHVIQLAAPYADAYVDSSLLRLHSKYNKELGHQISPDSVSNRIDHRIAEITHVPAGNCHPLKVLCFNQTTNQALYHYFDDAAVADPTSKRFATMLIYLTDAQPDAGGETVFPSSLIGHDAGLGLSKCAAQHAWGVKPKRGDALLVYNLTPDGVTDTASLFADCPVLSGEKWVATKRFLLGSYKKD